MLQMKVKTLYIVVSAENNRCPGSLKRLPFRRLKAVHQQVRIQAVFGQRLNSFSKSGLFNRGC